MLPILINGSQIPLSSSTHYKPRELFITEFLKRASRNNERIDNSNLCSEIITNII